MRQIVRGTVTLLALGVCALVEAQSTSNSGATTMSSRYQQLEIAARSADLRSPSSIDDLTHSVVTCPHVFALPAPLSQSLEQRLSRAEISYREGRGRGVTEHQLVEFLNSLAQKLNLPDYAKTTPAQLRVLRMTSATQWPVLMGTGLSGPKAHVGSTVNETMSPLQAMHLLGLMIDQKIVNPMYQDTTADPDVLFSNDQSLKKADVGGAPQSHAARVEVRHNPKHAEMRSAISAGAESMTIQDAIDIVDQALDTMGIN